MRVTTTALIACCLLAGCGGGGGGGGGSSPPVPQGPTVANTSSPEYLPLLTGNNWTFQSGGTISDVGPRTIVCSCSINNKTVERLDLTSPGGASAGSFYYAKGTWPNAPYAGHKITYLVGVRKASSTTITPAYYNTDGSVPGAPMMDNAPTSGEVLSLNAMNPPDPTTTTIQSAGGTQPYGSNQIIQSIATATTSLGSSSIAFAYAQGVGFTNVISSGQSNLLTAFSINAISSQSVRREAERMDVAGGNPANALRTVVAGLF